MTVYLIQKGWGRSCVHLSGTVRNGHWRWHRPEIRRELFFTRLRPNTHTANSMSCWSTQAGTK